MAVVPAILNFSPDTNIVGDGETNSNIITLQGSGDSGQTVKIFDHGELIGSVVVKSNGTWTFKTDELTDGSHEFTAKNEGDPDLSDALDVMIDRAITSFASSNNSKVVIDGDTYDVQNGNKNWSIKSPDSHTLRFEVRPGDQWSSDPGTKERTEISGHELYSSNQIVTVTYDLMIEDGPTNTADWMALGQFHSDDPTSSPPVALEMIGDKMAFNLRYSGKTSSTYLYKDSAPIERDRYYNIKMEVNFENNSGGFLKIWRDGELLVNYTGPVGYGNEIYWKMGIYRYESSETYAVNYRNFDISTKADNGTSNPTLYDSNSSTNKVVEAADDGTQVGITAAASGLGGSVSYSLTDDAGGRFKINASTGVVSVADGSKLDADQATSHEITVKATGNSGSLSADFNVSVTKPAVASLTDSNSATNKVTEGASSGTQVGIKAAASNIGGSVEYTLTDDAGGRFKINSSTGVVTVANGDLLDIDSATSHRITVKATGNSGSVSSNFNIAVSELLNPKISDSNSSSNRVAEGAANGTLVGITARAEDVTGTITYSLTDSAGGRFKINASTGVVSVANGSLLDFDSSDTHRITVKAAGNSGSVSTNFNVAITDVLSPTLSDGNSSSNAVVEGAGEGSDVGITAVAREVGGSVTYSLIDDAGGRFRINASTGVVSVADSSLFDVDVAESHDITVRATGNSGTATRDFTVGVVDSAASEVLGTRQNDTIDSGYDTPTTDSADEVFGKGGNDVIRGLDGDDRLEGGRGKDKIYTGQGADVVVFDSHLEKGENVDKILNFTPGIDSIELDSRYFSALTPGDLWWERFMMATEAQESDDRLIYNQETGKLFYDADGSGSGEAILFAVFEPNTQLSFTDFYVV